MIDPAVFAIALVITGLVSFIAGTIVVFEPRPDEPQPLEIVLRRRRR